MLSIQIEKRNNGTWDSFIEKINDAKYKLPKLIDRLDELKEMPKGTYRVYLHIEKD